MRQNVALVVRRSIEAGAFAFFAAGLVFSVYHWVRNSSVLGLSDSANYLMVAGALTISVLSLLYTRVRDALREPITLPIKFSIERRRGVGAHLRFIALSTGLALLFGRMIVMGLTPGSDDVVTTRLSNQNVVDEYRTGRGPCHRRITAAEPQGGHRYNVCLCGWHKCLPGTVDRKISGEIAGFAVSENWAGRSIVSIEVGGRPDALLERTSGE